MADLASLLVRIGADATSYLATMARAQSTTSKVFGAMRGVMRATTDEVVKTLGSDLPKGAQQAIKAFESLSGTAVTFGKNIKWTGDVSKVSGAQLTGLADAAFRVGQIVGEAIRPWVEETTGLANATSRLRSVNEEWVASLAADQELYEQQLALYDRMREKLGLIGDEYEIAGEATSANSRHLALMLDVVRDYSREQPKATKTVDEFTAGLLRLGREIEAQKGQLRSGEAAVGEFVSSLKEMVGITDTQNHGQAIEDLMSQFRVLAASGQASAEQLVSAFLPRIEQISSEMDAAGQSIPAPFRELNTVLEQGQGAPQVVDRFVDQIRTDIPDAAAIAKDALTASATAWGGAIRDARGELTALGRELDSLSKEVKIKITIDDAELQRWRRDNGAPDTSGRLPGP